MNTTSDLPRPSGPSSPASPEPSANSALVPSAKPASSRKPRFALFIATACGLGYIPFAPGTFGSLAGLALALIGSWVGVAASNISIIEGVDLRRFDSFLFCQCILGVLTALLGVWSAGRAANFWGEKDPQRVVIDEVSGQHLTLLLGCGVPLWWKVQPPLSSAHLGLITLQSALSWKYLLLGLILFRVFDIWKPFPVRQVESLPRGWGIMADDWVAAIYAAMGLWLARAAGL